MLDPRPLEGKVALVTGGSQGLGLGMALALAEAGADVAIAARRATRLKEAQTQIEAHGARVLICRLDLADVDAAAGLADDVATHFGRLDVLVTAAAAQLRKPMLEVTPDEWDHLVAVNLRSVFFLGQRAAHRMLDREPADGAACRGKIINVASLTAVGAWPNVSVYGATKGGIVQLTKAMALELAPKGICANAVGPGTFKTELTEKIYADPEQSRAISARVPMGRPGVPGDLAGATVFLASAASDYVTGQVLWVDGGWLVT